MNRSCYGINKVLDVKTLIPYTLIYKKYADSLTNIIILICHYPGPVEGNRSRWTPNYALNYNSMVIMIIL